MAFASKQIFHEHKDLVHHVAYDFHGKRIATCSSDQSVTVWDLNQNGVWVRSSSWKVKIAPRCPFSGHFSADARRSRLESDLGASRVWSDFGDMFIRSKCAHLGGSRYDGKRMVTTFATIILFVAVSDNDPERQGRNQQKSGPTTHWKKRTALVDSRSNVTDIKFAPRHLGLMLVRAVFAIRVGTRPF
jgi:nucleoporin SEH1